MHPCCIYVVQYTRVVLKIKSSFRPELSSFSGQKIDKVYPTYGWQNRKPYNRNSLKYWRIRIFECGESRHGTYSVCSNSPSMSARLPVETQGSVVRHIDSTRWGQLHAAVPMYYEHGAAFLSVPTRHVSEITVKHWFWRVAVIGCERFQISAVAITIYLGRW